MFSWVSLPAAEVVTGWRVDGTGLVPEATPPLQWDEASGKGIRWKTMMPNWSNSSPIVVANPAGKPRVLVMSEPIDWAPLLLCVDGDTGAVLWQREIDHLSVLPAEEAAKARGLWSAVLKREREKARLLIEKENLVAALAKKPDDVAQQAASAAFDVRLAALKLVPEKEGNRPWRFNDKDPDHRSSIQNCQRSWGLVFAEPWSLGTAFRPSTWIGFGYPTPVSDGKNIYVWTGYNAVAKYDLDGKCEWVVRLPPVKWPGCHFASNPVLADGKIILADAQYVAVYALDTTTGKIVWQDPISQNAQHSPHTPHLFLVAGVAYLFHPAGRIYRIADGKLMAKDLGAMGKGPGSPVMDGLRFYYNVGGDAGLARAVEVQVDGEGLKVVTLWEQKRLLISPRGQEGVCYQGRIYANDKIIDSATGKILGTLPFPKAKPSPDGNGWISRPNGIPFTVAANRYLFAGGEGGHYFNAQGTFWVFDLTAGTLVATNRLDFAPVDAAREAFIRGESGTDRWGTWGNSAMAFWKDRIFIRSLDRLYCIGDPTQVRNGPVAK